MTAVWRSSEDVGSITIRLEDALPPSKSFIHQRFASLVRRRTGLIVPSYPHARLELVWMTHPTDLRIWRQVKAFMVIFIYERLPRRFRTFDGCQTYWPAGLGNEIEEARKTELE